MNPSLSTELQLICNHIMSKEVEVKASTDIINNESSARQDSSGSSTQISSEQINAEATPSPKDTSASDINELKGLTQQLIDLAKTQTETIATQREEIAKLKEDLNTLNTDYQNSKPLDRRAEVVGLFDWGKQLQTFTNEHYKSEKEYAYSLFKGLQLEFPEA